MSSLTFWLIIGFVGQALFTTRFLIQWVVSEKNRAPVVPVAFWWLSLLGGIALLAYALSRHDPVIITGQGMGVFVYVRNLVLINKARKSRVPSWSGSTLATSSVKHRPAALEVR